MTELKTRAEKATIIAFGNKSNQKLETAMWAFAHDVDPDFKLRSLYRILNRITPENYRYDWTGAPSESRSEEYRRNAWLNFTPIFYTVLDKHEDDDDFQTVTSSDLRRFCGAWMEHWHAAFPFNPDDPTGGELQNKFAWYDMAVGMRAALLSQILFHTHRGVLPKPMIKNLLSCAKDHLKALRITETWASHSNHGFFQSAGLFALSVQTPDISDQPEADRKLAGQRLRRYLESTFSEDGIHLEHSCEYHNFMFKALSEIAPLLDSDITEEKWMLELFERMQNAMSAMILPNHLVAPFGDGRYTTADATIPKNPDILDVLNPALKADLLKSKAPSDIKRLLKFYKGGYTSYKDRRATADNSYLGVSAWHHSIVHKHVDELSQIWAENSVPILSDAGRYGYEGKTEDTSKLRREGFFYSDPKRVFVESAQAHNTVEIDRKSDNRRLALPYQSGLAASTTLPDGRVVIDTEIVREPLVRHQRLFIYTPSNSLIVIDELTDERWKPEIDPERNLSKLRTLLTRKSTRKTVESLPPRTYTQWHQFFPAWLLSSDQHGVSAEFDKAWQAKYFDDKTKAKTSLLSDQTIPAATYKVHARGAAWTSEKGSHTPNLNIHSGEIDETGRYMGWASLWPLTLKPSGAISQTIITDSTTALFAAVFKMQDDKSEEQFVKDLSIQPLSDGERILKFQEGGESHVIQFKRNADCLELSFADDKSHEISRSLVERNIEAQALYRARAAIKGNAPSSVIFDLFQAASSSGWRQSLNEAADYARSIGDTEKHLEMASLAQQKGGGAEALSLARIHLDKMNAVYDPGKARGLLEYAVEQNVRAAHYFLGNLYLDDTFPENDLALARNEFRRGAVRGHIGSMVRYSKILADESNYVDAVKWLNSAIEAGSSEAHMILGDIFSSDTIAPEYFDTKIAATHYELAGKAGSAMAAYKGAKIFMNPDMAAYDIDRAIVLLKIAAEKGSKVAGDKLEKLRGILF